MTYSGEVHVGGPPDTREIDGLTVTKIAVGPMDNNAYLLRCASTGQGLLIDAANEAGRLIELIGDTPVGTIVTTHRHADHWQALPEVQTRTGAVVYSIKQLDDVASGDGTNVALAERGQNMVAKPSSTPRT